MRINVYSQELTSEVKPVEKTAEGIDGPEAFKGVMLMLHSPELLHHTAEDDDRSAVVFWLPKSKHRKLEMAAAFREIAEHFENS